ncbi:LOW QUALITY PROTEIN: hypothetical protein Cgig2_019772 [Carnegiea gigantea]|uniref:Uncharacterized protein n=1 Tax=Carnegiea gigantea TaxID=171969 RepID=A0A9Q1JGQ2_9CARY|nr:LOW QUALITY PROTEIN: hypothetical protein Cgig2_019772 [Carnegiea gigantea]
MIPGKPALWMMHNFDICSCNPIRVIEHDVHMTLGLPKGKLKVVEHNNESNGQVDGGEDFRRNFIMLVVSTCLHGNHRREINHLKSDENDVKVEDKIGVSKVKDDISFLAMSIVCLKQTLFRGGGNRFDNNQQSTVGRSDNRIGGIDSWSTYLLERVRKAATESTIDALISDRPNKAKIHHTRLTRGMSQEKKETLPKGVVIVDSEYDIATTKVQALNGDVHDTLMRLQQYTIATGSNNGMFSRRQGRSVMRIIEPDLQMQDIQITTNTNKGKAIVVEAPKR